jgi:NTP pyrophosphatase (non-canonical NTP hydrolase)
MTPDDYQRLASRTECNQKAAAVRKVHDDMDNEHRATRLIHAALGLSGEAGEFSGAVERWLHYGQPLDLTNLKEEIGDCLWYLALACNACGFSLDEIMQANIAKLQKRYPDKYSDFNASEENRSRDSERQAVENTVNEIFSQHDLYKTGDPDAPNYILDRNGEVVLGQCRRCGLVEAELVGPCKVPYPKDEFSPNKYCYNCKTPFSDRRPKFCPECGVETAHGQ